MKKEIVVKSNFITEPWFKEFSEKVEAVMEEYNNAKVEFTFSLKWEEITAKHKLGELVEKYKSKAPSEDKFVQETAEKLHMSKRSLYQCVQFYNKFPKLDKVPGGKEMNFTKIVKNFLTEGGTDPANCKHKEHREIVIRVCKSCGRRETVKDESDTA